MQKYQVKMNLQNLFRLILNNIYNELILKENFIPKFRNLNF